MLDTKKRNFEAYLDLKTTDIENVIHELWISKDKSLWSEEPYFYIRLGEIADKLGQVMFAHDVLKEGLRYFPDNLRITQLFALSLIKCGFLLRARELLTDLVKKGHEDEETLGILGRVYKDMWLISGRSSSDDSYLRRSRNLYFQAFKKNRGYYSGINAASLSLMMGERETAEHLAKIVLGICFNLLKKPENRDYWSIATIGEGYIVLGNNREAKKFFTLAKKLSIKNYSYLASTKKQLKLLSNYTDVPEDTLSILGVPSIVAFTGHMVDHPDRKVPRFPSEIEETVKEELRGKLQELNPGVGYSSIACGSDILFLECMQERKAETNVILPFELEDFFKTSINFAGPEWIERARRVLQKSSLQIQATEGKYSGDDLLFDYANYMIMGKTILRSEMLETEPVLLAVWDGERNAATGGTYEFIRTWEKKKLRVELIDLNGMDKPQKKINQIDKKTAILRSHNGGNKLKKVRRALKVMLFADLVGFSTIKEEQLPFYINNYLGALARNLKKSGHKPLYKNIWGDALYFVFEDLITAAEYALGLRDFVRELDWKKIGLPEGLSIRIGLHAGPVFFTKEPILKKINYFGTHVNTAARIEPITNPGNVYASEQFAALFMAKSQNSDLECKYVGIIVLPKKFGKYPIYLVKRKNEIE